MRLIHIVGKKNQGKTTLVVALVEVLTRRGLRVGTIKHCHQSHELDTLGKDTYRHRVAGASTVAAFTPALTAVYRVRNAPYDVYSELASDFDGCDLVLVEGDAQGPGPKLEVWRSENGVPPLAAERTDIAGVVTDDREALLCYCRPGFLLPRFDIDNIADAVVQMAAAP